MALLHHATLQPSKLDLLAGWLPTQPWSARLLRDSPPERVAAFRFDDPAGKVGVETLIVRVGNGAHVQVPVTYREAPLADGESSLIGTMEHSVLGTRWVYDATGDPVYLWTIAHAILTGGAEAEQFYDSPNGPEPKADATHVVGSGTEGSILPHVEGIAATSDANGTIVVFGALRLSVHRTLTPREPADDSLTLVGTWEGQSTPVLLAELWGG